jgi:hypothetical protein
MRPVLDVNGATLRLCQLLTAYLPNHSFSLEVKFTGPTCAIRRVVLNTDPAAFGDQGGAEVQEKDRSAKAMTLGTLDECDMPFELLTVSTKVARYSVAAGPSELEIAASRFIGGLTNSWDMVAAFHRLVTRSQDRMLCYQVKTAHDSVVVTLVRRIPKVDTKKRKRRSDEDEEIGTW